MTFSKIYVEPSAGVYIGDFMAELHTLSVKYKCDVNAKFNGKEITVKPEQESGPRENRQLVCNILFKKEL